jgi:ABC-2 type transport system ATP-binding protein
MIKITKLTKSYGKQKVVENLSLEIKKGEIFGFLGPNGAGKTTAMKVIVGLNQPDDGKVEIEGNNLEKLASRQIIGYMPENANYYDHLAAEEFLIFMINLFANKKSKVKNQKSELKLKIQKLLELVGLKDVGKKPIQEFSKGMKQRLGLAQALINNPDYLFLDEPLDGLDPIGRLEFKKIFLTLKKQGKTIFLNSHILSDIEEICDKIGIINKGKLIYSGEIKKFTGRLSLEKKFVEAITK